jgi:hypothetical protein
VWVGREGACFVVGFYAWGWVVSVCFFKDRGLRGDGRWMVERRWM